MRSDNDTWDITSSVGSTALFVAAARALEAQKTDPLVVDSFAETFCRAVGGEWADVLDGGAPDHALRTDDFGSLAAVEEAAPMDAAAFEAKREEERSAGDEDNFFTLVYNEQHEPAAR